MASMQYDVLASQPITSTGQLKDQNGNNILRARIKGVYGVSGALAGSVVLRDGGADGKILMTLNSPTAANSGTFWFPLPGEGILAETNVHATLSNVASFMIIYG